MNHIIETIGKWGVKTTPIDERISSVHAGDVVQFPEEYRHYPVSYAECRVDHIDNESGLVHMVDGMGSAFLDADAKLDISGGPCFSLPIECLEPMHATRQTHVWNWGDHSMGAGQGVDYHIDRPMFRVTASPSDFETRYSRNGEEHARQGGKYRHGSIDDAWQLVRTWPDHHGLTAYLFRTNN